MVRPDQEGSSSRFGRPGVAGWLHATSLALTHATALSRRGSKPGCNMAQDVDGEWLSVSAAARRLGLSRQALQQRIRRKTVVCRHDNTGSPQVFVSGARRETEHATPALDVAQVAASVQQALQGLLSLDDVRQLLGEQRLSHESAMATLERSHRESVQLLVERVDAAEVRAETAEQRLADSRRPWWSRWLGHSKKSDLG